ncbi:MAG: hypothetical protein R3Y50_03205 [Rikenellaceae bacterium]
MKKFFKKALFNTQFYTIWVFAKLFGLLPTFLHYAFSDFLFYVLRYGLKYRVAVVRDNLKEAFPTYSDSELKKIEIDYFRHLADIFVETILIASISEKKLKKRMVFTDLEKMESIAKESSVALVASAHFASWEYTIIYGALSGGDVYGVYHPLTDKVMDLYFKKARSRFKTKPLPMASVGRAMIKAKKSENYSLFALIADQTPPRGIIDNWYMFFNRPTAFYTGIEKLSKGFKAPLLFLDVEKVKRGHYRAKIEVVYDGNEEMTDHEITKRYIASLEKMITKSPHLWLWSHRRWKHFPPSEDRIVY